VEPQHCTHVTWLSMERDPCQGDGGEMPRGLPRLIGLPNLSQMNLHDYPD
jgi:hypothetical protein